MKLKLILALFIIGVLNARSQNRAQPDVIETNKGSLTIQPITHGTVVLSWNEKTIYVDPYGGAEGFSGLKDPDIILITDIHGDHLNTQTLQGLNTANTTFIIPQAVADQMKGIDNKEVKVLGNGNNTLLMGIDIAAIPMYNLPNDETSRHTKGRGNGYVLSLGGKKIYLSGDTEDIPEMRKLKNIDIAFVCMNLPYTMDINQAASAVLEFKPSIMYPYHYRGSDVEAFKKLVNQGNRNIDVRLKEWYPGN